MNYSQSVLGVLKFAFYSLQMSSFRRSCVLIVICCCVQFANELDRPQGTACIAALIKELKLTEDNEQEGTYQVHNISYL